MQSALDKIFELKSFKKSVDKIISSENNIAYVSPMVGCTKSYFISLIEKRTKQIVVLFPDIQSASEFNVELNVLDLNKNVLSLTEFKPEIVQEVLTEISSKEKFILVSTYDLLNSIFPAKDKLEQKTTKIQTGGEITFNDLVEYLNLLNYQKDKFVEAPGDYSQRGSIIDFWSYSEQNPVRLEFDGDFLESIRYFDPESQRSIEIIENVTLAAPIETDSVTPDSSSIFDYLSSPVVLASSYELNNLENKIINPFSG
ncbi:MAG: transcription-repair coupling factor, partial [Ignavibacteriaceae bacterium]